MRLNRLKYFTLLILLISIFLAVTGSVSAGATLATGANAGLNVAQLEASVQRIIYVNPSHANASDSNSGTASMPVRTIGRADILATNANRQGIGVKVLISPGVYREKVSYGGTTAAPVIFEAVTPGQVIMSGADVWTGWTDQGNGLYSHAWNYDWGLMPIPSLWISSGFNQPIADIVRRREIISVNGQMLAQVLSTNYLTPGTFYINESQNYVFIKLAAGTAINSQLIEVGARDAVFQLSTAQNVIVRGMTFRHSVSPYNSSAVFIGDSSGVLLENNTLSWNNGGGLGIGQSNNIISRGNTYADNGATGLGGTYVINFLSENDRVQRNNWRGAIGNFLDWSVGGVKQLHIHNATYRNLNACNNYAPGLWLDTDNQNILIENSILCSNYTYGVYFEASQGPLTVRNSIIANNQSYGVHVRNSEDVALINNIIYGNLNAQIYLTGRGNGRGVTNFETNQNYTLSPVENLLMQDNITISKTSSVPVVQTTMTSNSWTTFVNTITSASNIWYNQQSPNIFRVSSGSTLSLQQWQSQTNQDCESITTNVQFSNPDANNFTITSPGGRPATRPVIALSGPTNTITTTMGNPAYTWSAISGVSNYEVAVFRADNMVTPYYYSGVLPSTSTCTGGTCSVEPTVNNENVRLRNGAHVVYLRADVCGWRGPFNFTLNAPAPAPVSTVNLTNVNILRPTANWTLSGAATNATWFNIFIIRKADFDAGNYGAALVNYWASRASVCGSLGGTTCQLQSTIDFQDNTRYYFYVQSYGPGGYSAGGVYNNGWAGAEFRVDTIPDPNLPQNISVTLNQGRPTIQWSDDAKATRFRVAIFNWTTNAWVYGEYHNKPALNCNGTTCSLLTDAMNFANGSYSVYVNAEGAGGPSIDGPFSNGYNGPQNSANTTEPGDFVLNFTAPQLVPLNSLALTYAGGNATVSWQGVAGATWYYVFVGTYGGAYTAHLQWYSSTALGCQNIGTCSATIPLALPAGAYYVSVQSAGPGGFSVGGLVGNGFQVLGTPVQVP